MIVIEQYLLAASAGAVATAMLALLLHKLHSARTLARFQAETNGRIHTLTQTNAQQNALIDQGQQEMQELESSIAQLHDDLAKQSKIAGEDRAALEASVEDKENLLDHARRIAAEASRLKSLAATFERWHEQMISLMTQNQDMHAKNQELSSIVKHVVIVSLNASIEAARAGNGRPWICGGGRRSTGTRRAFRRALAELPRQPAPQRPDDDRHLPGHPGGRQDDHGVALSSVESLADQFHARLH